MIVRNYSCRKNIFVTTFIDNRFHRTWKVFPKINKHNVRLKIEIKYLNFE